MQQLCVAEINDTILRPHLLQLLENVAGVRDWIEQV